MTYRIIPLILTCACVSVARADFNPVPLTPNSYTFDIVVPATFAPGPPDCITVTAGSGSSKGDNTYYEQGIHPVDSTGHGANSGIPPHNTVFTNINNANETFLMPPTYTTNNEIIIDQIFTTGMFNLNTPTTVTGLSFLCCGGGGEIVINYTVTHADASVETGTLDLPDWFHGGSTVAWGANGRIDQNGNYNNYNSSFVNNNPPYLYANNITVSGASPVVSVTFDTPSNGNHANLFAVSGNNGGSQWTPIPVGGFTQEGIVPASTPQYAVNATMDHGTNFSFTGNNTWFEQGYVRSTPSAGLPPSGSTFTSLSQPSHTYQMGNYYSGNNATLIDINHQSANITPVSAAPYSAFAFLTAGGNIGGNPMTNICILQHKDGVQETNFFLGFDWFDNNHNGAIAYKAGGRTDVSSRGVNQINNNYPYLFETYFVLKDTGSPVTNIVVQFGTESQASATTYIMAVSASAGSVPPVVASGPTPLTQTVAPGTVANIAVGVTGTAPITGNWQVDYGLGAGFVNLNDGLDANGSIIIGSHTYSLSISNVYVADTANYQFVAENVAGSVTSDTAILTVNAQTVTINPANPTYYTGNTFPLTAVPSAGAALNYQWYYIDNASNSNNIPGATNAVYTVANVPLAANGFTYGVIAYNVYGTNGNTVSLSISDSAAFLVADLAPLSAEAYAGAPVTYSVNAQGNSPIAFQWWVNGSVVSGATNSSYTLAAPCGLATIQASFSNALSGGVAVTSSQATLQGDPTPTNITFNVNGGNWTTNGAVAIITNNTLVLTDNNGGEANSAFYNQAQFVGGAWTASYTYNSHGGGADGSAFVIQTTNTTALGGGGGQLGYTGIGGGSLAFEINLYGPNTPGIAIATDGVTGGYQPAGNVDVTSTNDIWVVLNWANGVLTANLTEANTGATYTTNKTIGSIIDLLGGNVAYVGFTGADGGVSSFQTVSNFSFHSVLPPVWLSTSAVTGNSLVLSWPAADPTYHLQTTSTLSPSAWVAGPAPVNVGGTNQVTVNVNSSKHQYYRLVRVACQ